LFALPLRIWCSSPRHVVIIAIHAMRKRTFIVVALDVTDGC
jgi:hypothetical protein